MGLAQTKASGNFGGAGVFALAKCAHPGPGPGECEDERLINAPRRSGIARNKNLLARAGATRGAAAGAAPYCRDFAAADCSGGMLKISPGVTFLSKQRLVNF